MAGSLELHTPYRVNGSTPYLKPSALKKQCLSKVRRAGQYVMLERSEASLPGWPLRLFTSLKRSSLAVVAGTLEDENYQAAVTPSEAEGSKALRPQSSCA